MQLIAMKMFSTAQVVVAILVIAGIAATTLAYLRHVASDFSNIEYEAVYLGMGTVVHEAHGKWTLHAAGVTGYHSTCIARNRANLLLAVCQETSPVVPGKSFAKIQFIDSEKWKTKWIIDTPFYGIRTLAFLEDESRLIMCVFKTLKSYDQYCDLITYDYINNAYIDIIRENLYDVKTEPNNMDLIVAIKFTNQGPPIKTAPYGVTDAVEISLSGKKIIKEIPGLHSIAISRKGTCIGIGQDGHAYKIDIVNGTKTNLAFDSYFTDPKYPEEINFIDGTETLVVSGSEMLGFSLYMLSNSMRYHRRINGIPGGPQQYVMYVQ